MKLERLFNNEFIDRISSAKLSRKGFLKTLGAALGMMLIPGTGRRALARTGYTLKPRTPRAVKTDYDIAVVKGKDPAAITRKAVETLGGMGRFVKRGDVVVVKPNIGWDRTPEQAANTNPQVVAALVTMARECGAKTVKVFDNTCQSCLRTYVTSGIQEAARKAGATVYFVNEWKFLPAEMPGRMMHEWPIFKDAVECDVFINVPIAKSHGHTQLTLSIKNLMGICGGSRGKMHQDISEKLVDVAQFIRPELTVVDCYRILLRHGPTGGDLADVAEKNTVIASADPVLADAYAAGLFNVKPDEIGYIAKSARAGLGSMNIAAARRRELTV